MTRRRAWVTRLICAAAVVTASASLNGYVTSGRTWASNAVLYYINPSSTQLSPAALTAAIQEAAAAWTVQTLANVQLVYGGTTSGASLTLNNKNEVFFRNDASGFAGETYWWYDWTNRLVDADIVIHEGGTRLYIGSGCSGNGIYLDDLMVHEFGHALGLEHSSVFGATMYPVMPSYCDQTQLTLHADDIAGIESMYPSGSTSQTPTAPTNLSVTTGGTTSLALSWTDRSNNESGFYVDRSADGQSFSRVAQLAANTVSYNDGLLTAGTTYYYRVAAFNGAGSASSNTASGQTAAPAPTVPSAPGNLTITSPTTSSLTLSWTDYSNNESGFYIDVSTNGSAFTRLTQVGAGVTAYAALSLSPATSYWFRVSAFNGAGASGFSNVATGQTSASPAAPSTTRPANPWSLAVSGATASTLTLTWTDNASNETGFYIEMSADGTSFSRVGEVGANVTSYVSSGLASSRTYYFQVQAFSGAGGSSYSNKASGQTTSTSSGAPSVPSGTRPSAPWNLAVSSATSSSLGLTWSDNSSNETGFYVEVSSDGTSFSRVAEVGANVSSYTVSGLASSRTYYVQVQAFNGAGGSSYSNKVTGQTNSTSPSAPTAPSGSRPSNPWGLTVASATASSLTLAWSDNSTNESGFYIEMSTDGTSFNRVAEVGANVTTYAASGLTSSRTYYFQVQAFNAAGGSSYSNKASGQTSAAGGASSTPAGSRPANPWSLVISNPTASSLTLSWSDNASNESGFYIEMSTDGTSFNRVAQVGADTTSYTVTGLNSLRTYYFQVQAFNAAGVSSYSNKAVAVTTTTPSSGQESVSSGTRPANPWFLVVSGASATSLTLSWADNSTNEDGFYIEMSAGGVAFSRFVQVGANATSYTVGNLSPSTTYYFQVQAFNAAGGSSYSNMANARTNGQ